MTLSEAILDEVAMGSLDIPLSVRLRNRRRESSFFFPQRSDEWETWLESLCYLRGAQIMKQHFRHLEDKHIYRLQELQAKERRSVSSSSGHLIVWEDSRRSSDLSSSHHSSGGSVDRRHQPRLPPHSTLPASAADEYDEDRRLRGRQSSGVLEPLISSRYLRRGQPSFRSEEPLAVTNRHAPSATRIPSVLEIRTASENELPQDEAPVEARFERHKLVDSLDLALFGSSPASGPLLPIPVTEIINLSSVTEQLDATIASSPAFLLPADEEPYTLSSSSSSEAAHAADSTNLEVSGLTSLGVSASSPIVSELGLAVVADTANSQSPPRLSRRESRMLSFLEQMDEHVKTVRENTDALYQLS